MKIATYNLRFGGNRNNRTHWQKIFDAVQPDIFLVQETCDPKIYLEAEFYAENCDRILWQNVTDCSWGSALYVAQGSVKSIVIPELAGWVIGAEVRGFGFSGDRLLRVFSIHAPRPKGSSYIREVGKVLDFIAAKFQDDYDLVIGGDFNTDVSIRFVEQPIDWSKMGWLDRMEREFGLINCWQAANPSCKPAQTLRWSRKPIELYHCDGIFAPASWYRYLEFSEVLQADWESMSDHNPVVAAFGR